MKYYVVLDTNVIVSALHPKNKDTAISELIDIIFSDNIIILYDERILNEYRNVLNREELGIKREKIGSFINYIKKYGRKITTKALDDIFNDEEDKKFYEIALSTRDKGSYLVTGNLKHFPIKDFVVSPKNFMRIYKKYE